MRSGEFCGSYGGNWTIGCSHNAKGTIYHRRTHIMPCGLLHESPKSSESSWIAVLGKEFVCFVGEILDKPDISDIVEIFVSPPWDEPMAIVSVVIGTSGDHGGSGIAVSVAEFNEKVSINFLKKILRPGTFSFDEKETTISAFKHLCPGKFKDDKIKFQVVRKDDIIPKSFPSNKIARLSNVSSSESDSESDVSSIDNESDVSSIDNESDVSSIDSESDVSSIDSVSDVSSSDNERDDSMVPDGSWKCSHVRTK